MSSPNAEIRAGFIPLLDAAPLIAARELGFAAEEGLILTLTRETSWATIRDRLAVGHLDVAHALAPLPIAANLGLGPLPGNLVVPMAFGCGANTVTVSHEIWSALAEQGAEPDLDAAGTLRALVRVVATRRQRAMAPLVFGIVHQHSAHRYQLAYWLAAGRIVPGRDVEFVVVPPSLMPAALANGGIDGFCAGEPWGSLAAAEGSGRMVTTNAHIWRSSPEKVLAARDAWVSADAAKVDALIRSLYRACAWCDAPHNRAELADLLARPEYVALPAAVLTPSLSRRLLAADGALRDVPALLNFAGGAASFPWTSHALWFFSQMVRWDEAELSDANVRIARHTYRPDIYRRALASLGTLLPSANAKVEGALRVDTGVGSPSGRLILGKDGFFDDMIFDPDLIAPYIETLRAGDTSDIACG